MATVYIAHIGKDDEADVLETARLVGSVVSHQKPKRSKKAKHEVYRNYIQTITGVPEEYSFYMKVTMASPDEARDLIITIGTSLWDTDYIDGRYPDDTPKMYAQISIN